MGRLVLGLMSLLLIAAASQEKRPDKPTVQSEETLIARAPQYEGVYLLTKDGKLTRLTMPIIKKCSVIISDQTAAILNGAGRAEFTYIEGSAARALPVFDPKAIKGIYIKARGESLNFLALTAEAIDFLEGRKILTGVYGRDGCSRGDEDINTAVAITKGVGRDKLNILPIDTVTEYIDLESSRILEYTMTFSATSTTLKIPMTGINLATNRGSYPILLKVPRVVHP